MNHGNLETFSSKKTAEQREKRVDLARKLVDEFNEGNPDNPVSFDGQHILVDSADQKITTHLTILDPYPDGKSLREHIADALEKEAE